ncbi:hypothetical protein ACFX2C_044385 [Malus domestica]
MKSDKVDSVAKVAPKPSPLAAGSDSPTEKKETARVSSCEKSTKFVSREAAEICALLRPYLLEDIAKTSMDQNLPTNTCIVLVNNFLLTLLKLPWTKIIITSGDGLL